MSKLFIIGNGFDLAHGLPTKYENFRNWLIKKHGIEDTTINKLRDVLSQNYEFEQIIDSLKERFQMGNFEPYESLGENLQDAQKFITDAAEEWYKVMEDEMSDKEKDAYLKGMADTPPEKGKKIAFLNGLKEANYESLLKILEKIGDEEWSQDNYDKALKDILKKEFKFELDVFTEKVSSELDFSKIYNIDTKTIANIIVVAIDAATTQEWDVFESKLGNLNLDLFLKQKDDEIDDSFLYHTVLMHHLPKIIEFFKEWINTIDVSKAVMKEKFRDEIRKGKCLFLNFNYTDTLELLYNVENVCHIHGSKDTEIILGHEGSADFSDFDEKMFKTTFKKLTGLYISRNREFFSSLKDVTEIYSIGFSFGEVDMPYIKEIFRNIDTKEVSWYLTKFDEDNGNNKRFRKEINEAAKEKGCPKFNIFDM